MRTRALALGLAFVVNGCGLSQGSHADEENAAGERGHGSGGGSGMGGSGALAGAGGSGGGGAGSAGSLDLECVATALTRTRLRLAVELVVSAGASMNQVLEGDGPTRWEATRESLSALVAALDPRLYDLGLVLFAGGEEQCAATVAASLVPLDGKNEVVSALGAVSELYGDGSLEAGVRLGLEELARVPLETRKVLVIATDVPANLKPGCDFDLTPHVSLSQALGAADGQGVLVIPVGLPGTTVADEDLSQIGSESGQCFGNDECFFSYAEQPDFGAELAAFLVPPAVDLTCSFSLPELPGGKEPDPSLTLVELSVDGGEPRAIPFADECADRDGYELIQPGAYSLCPMTCETMVASISASLKVTACAPP